MKTRWIAIGVIAVLGGSYGAYSAIAQKDHKVPPSVTTDTPKDRRQTLADTRLAGDPAALDAFLAAQRDVVAAANDDDRGFAWHVLAEALLERVVLENARKGMQVGQPTYPEVPKQIQAWLDEGIQAVEASRKAGLDSSESHRLESALWSNQIVGMGSALKYTSRVGKALDKAEAMDPNNPHVQVGRGLKALLAPRMLGHNPSKALEHLSRGAEGLPSDERPRVFCAMAAWLLDRPDETARWLEEAIRLNPGCLYALAVKERLAAKAEDPFAADVTDAEAERLGPKSGG